MMLNKMRLSTKLAVGFGTPLVIVLAVTLVTYLNSREIMAQARAAHAEATESTSFAGLAHEMKLDVVQIQQYLSDVSATRGQDGLDDGFDEAAKRKGSFLAASAKFKEMFAGRSDAAGLGQLELIEQKLATYYEVGTTMAKAYTDGGPATGNKLMPKFDQASLELAAALDPFIKQQTTQSNDAMSAIVSSVHTLSTSVVWGTSFAVLLGAVLGVFITRGIVKPVTRIITALGQGAEQVDAASVLLVSDGRGLGRGFRQPGHRSGWVGP